MKNNIHPKYYKDAIITCACGNKLTIGSTVQNIHVELCSKCHPFYTGKQKLVDTENRVKKFRAKKKAALHVKTLDKKAKQNKRASKTTHIKAGKKLTLKDMLTEHKKKSK